MPPMRLPLLIRMLRLRSVGSLFIQYVKFLEIHYVILRACKSTRSATSTSTVRSAPN